MARTLFTSTANASSIVGGFGGGSGSPVGACDRPNSRKRAAARIKRWRTPMNGCALNRDSSHAAFDELLDDAIIQLKVLQPFGEEHSRLLPFDAFEANLVREASLIGWLHVRKNVGRPVGCICRDYRQMVRQTCIHMRNAVAQGLRQPLVASIHLCLIEAEQEGPIVGRKCTQAVKSTQAHRIDRQGRRVDRPVVVTGTQAERGRFFAFQRVAPKSSSAPQNVRRCPFQKRRSRLEPGARLSRALEDRHRVSSEDLRA